MQILFNGHIYTQDPNQPIAQALAIEGSRVLAVGTNENILALANRSTSHLDLEGQTVWPGLADAHLHLQHFAQLLSMVDCETSSQQECLQRVAERARHTPPGKWIVGHGWNQNLWPEGFGSAADLDAISSQHPIYLTAKSLHAGWANSRALQLCGISTATPDPKNGKIQRNQDGQPTGILLEMGAMELVSHFIPTPGQADLVKIIADAQPTLWSMGLTSVNDFDPFSCFTALQTLHQEGKLRLRVVKGLPLPNLPQAVSLVNDFRADDWLSFGALKLFADGALGPHTAAMLAPFDNDPENIGMLLLTKEEILQYGKTAAAAGLGLAIHAIGDRAVREVLDGLTLLRQYEAANSLPHLRHRIEHVQLIHPQDIPRLAELGIIASMQPIHAPSDQLAAETCWGTRCATAYAWRTLAHTGVQMAFGSDAPVESPNPFWGLAAAVTRQLPNSTLPPWRPEECLSIQQALDGFTTGPAFANGKETHLGRLTSGYLADLIVLSQDPFALLAEAALPPCNPSLLKPEATMIGGEWVWQATDRPSG